MSYRDVSTEQLIQAAALTPAFLGAYKAGAPPAIRVDGKTYLRDDARNASERVWYLAAVAMQNPKAVYAVGNQGANEMALAWDESQVQSSEKVKAAREAVTTARERVSAAEKEVADARKFRDDAKRGDSNSAKEIAATKKQIADLEARIADLGRVKDAGDFFGAVVTSGLSKLVPKADLEIRLGNHKNHLHQLEANAGTLTSLPEAEAALTAAQSRLDDAKSQLAAAERAVVSAEDSVRQALRDDEERIRQEEARKRSEAAAERAAEDARRRQQAAEDAYNEWVASSGSGGAGGDYYGDAGGGWYTEPEWGSTDWATTDPDAELGDTEYLDEQADIYGDVDEALKMAELNDEPIIGVNTVISPYSIDRYYEGYDLERDEVFGNDTAGLVAGIVAGVLTMAPAIINAVSPPPSKDQSAADPNVGSGKLGEPGEQGQMGRSSSSSSTGNAVDDFLVKIGLKKTINDAAAAAGGAAGSKGGQEVTGTVTGYLVAAAVIGGLVYVATR